MVTTQDRPLTVLVSGANFDGVRGSERALTESFLRYCDVLWVDPPSSPATPRRYRRFGTATPSWRPDVTEVRHGLYRLTPVVLPGLTRPGVRLTTWPLVRNEIRWALRRLGRSPVAVVSASLDDVLRGWPSGTVRVLYGTDDWVAGAALMGQNAATLTADERRAVAAADVVLAVTPELADRWRALGADPVLLPNGCDPDAYLAVDTVSPAVLPAGFPTPVAGVVGQLNDRLDADLLAAVADTGIGLLLVGPRDPGWLPGRFDELTRRPNVHHTGAVPFADLPAWLARMDVGLTPYTDTAFNRASFPLKTLEYLAAGRPVVGSDLPAARGLAARSQDVVAVAGAAAFARHTVAAARAPRTPDVVARRRQIVAARHSWAARAARLAALLGLPTDLAPPTGHDGPALPEWAATNGTRASIHTVTDRGAGRTDIPRSTG